MRTLFLSLAVLTGFSATAAERAFNFGEMTLDQAPPGFHSIVGGEGKPGEWKIILDEMSGGLEPINPKAPAIGKRAVLAQVARDPRDAHFPMLIFEGEKFDSFKMTSRFKLVGGAVDQTAGFVFRFLNESNFYLIGASSLGNSFRVYKIANGEMKPPIGPEMEITKGVWHDMTVECDGNRIVGTLDGKEAIKLVDSTASEHLGKVGFWTKSDSVSYFIDSKVIYSQKEILARMLVRDTLKAYPRLDGLKIFAVRPGETTPVIVASKDEKELGQAGGKIEQDVMSLGKPAYGRDKQTATVTIPLRDRNGEPIAAVRVVLKSFPGQTVDNALARAQPVVHEMQVRVQSLEDLLQ